MADFRLGKPKKQNAAQADPAQSKTLLQQAGGVATSGLHTVGSILSTPARVAYGTINGLAGLPGGYGNQSLLDSTGGIEAADLLENLGLHPKNDPTKWEASDFSRFGLNVLGDPTSWVGAGGLTKAGVTAFKKGALTKGVVNSIAKGERGLLSFHHPLASVSSGAIGSGPAAAKAVEGVGNAVAAVGKKTGVSSVLGPTVRHLKTLVDSRLAGRVHPTTQKNLLAVAGSRQKAKEAIDADMFGLALRHEREGIVGPGHGDVMRDVVEGKPNLQATQGHIDLAAEMTRRKDVAHHVDKHLGIKTGDLVDDDVEHFPRKLLAGIKPERIDQVMGSSDRIVKKRAEIWKNLGGTNEINRLLKHPAVDAAINNSAHLPLKDQRKAARSALLQQFPNIDKKKATKIASIMVYVPDVRKQGLFGNDPLADLASYRHAANNRAHDTEVVLRSIAEHIGQNPGDMRLHEFFTKHHLDPKRAATQIARRTGRNASDVLSSTIPHDLAADLTHLTPGYTAPRAERAIMKVVKSLGTMWKGTTLAHPASRVRDAASGAVQNSLLGHGALPFFSPGWQEARNVVKGRPVSRDFSHLKEVKDLMDRHGLTSDQATRVLLAVHAPRGSGIVADLAPGQIGSTMQDILSQIPGRTQSGVKEVFGRAGKSLRFGEIGPGGTPINPKSTLMDVANPLNQRGVFDREFTNNGLVAASNVFGGASDEFNRHAGIAGQMAQGFEPSVAGARTRAAQVDYDQSKFTPFESDVLKQAMPFWSFTSRMAAHTAKELASRPGGPTAQLIKELDRSQARDASLPDSVLESTALPLGTSPDGTKRLLTGFGLMSEPAVKTLGSLAGGDLKGAGYDALGQLSPILRTPLENIVGQSFYQRGEPQQNLYPNIGGTLANIGTMTGLREADAGPVKYPGSQLAEMALGIVPYGRYASTARTLSDPRKNIFEKAANTLSGIRIQDVSPEKQNATLLKRAAQLVKESGGRVREDVYYDKNTLERLRTSDPALYKRQVELQGILAAIRARQPKGERKKAGIKFAKP